MTSEEIKASVSMRDILSKCGLPQPNRAGFIRCPFHKGDNSPSMKIYEKDYHCFACGANGDIFTFLQTYEGISFKDAFLDLGGGYQDHANEMSFTQKRRLYQRNACLQTKKRQVEAEEQEKERLRKETRLLWICVKMFEPLSDAWCECYNKLQIAEYRLEYLNGKR